MRYLFQIILVLICFQSNAQNSNTFYKSTQAGVDRLLDVYIDYDKQNYEVIGEIKTSLESGYFVYLVYNSFGELIQTVDLSYIYNHGFPAHNWDGGARFIDGKRFTLSYQVKLPPPVSRYNCFVNEDKSVISRNKAGLVAKIKDSNYIGVKQYEDSIIICNVNFWGNTYWNLSYDSIFKSKISNSRIFVIDTLITIIGFRNRMNNVDKYYEATVNTYGSILLPLDSFVYFFDSFSPIIFNKYKEGYFA